MDLPVRIQTEPGTEPVVSVDGAFGAPGLNLSHWPGNATPRELRHDLSTGIALAFARLDDAERERLATGCTALVNNHYDTDGLLAMLAVRRPREALARAAAMLDAAAAGDFFRFPSDRAFAIDCVVEGMADASRSPLAAELRGLDDVPRRERATIEMLERLPALLDGGLEPYRDLWEEALERLHRDVEGLATGPRDDLVHLDLAVWSVSPPASDPGRHALFGTSTADRALVLGARDGGTTARLLLSTKSFFDLVSERPLPRPDLGALARALNEREGTTTNAERAWRHQDVAGASPELWFGTAGLASYAEHAGEHLAPSALPPAAIKAAVVDALRAAWVFPEDEDGDEDQERG